MIDAVFISDLHLHPADQDIQARFDFFIEWAKTAVKKVYILGDFFHAWVGDDAIDDWSRGIAAQVNSLVALGIPVYYMHGNRDFLLGSLFAKQAGWSIINEPALIQLGGETIMLVHGDGYCTKDLSHQRFRRLTRNKLFTTLFLMLTLNYRKKLVNKIRERSQINYHKPADEMDVVADSVMKHMKKHKVKAVIHGHTHKPGLSLYDDANEQLKRYVLSDWDDIPQALCYHNTKGFYFIHVPMCNSGV